MSKLNPIVVDGIVRVGGRLQNAPLDDEMKHPIILPSEHHVTKLLIIHHHHLVGHSGAGMTWTAQREVLGVERRRNSAKGDRQVFLMQAKKCQEDGTIHGRPSS